LTIIPQSTKLTFKG